MKTSILSIFMLFCVATQAQDSLKPIRFIIQPSVGISIPLTTIQNGSITDNLISTRATPSFYFQVSGTYFWKHWGIGGSVTFNNSNNPQDFADDVEQYYGDQYYVNISDYHHNTSFSAPITKVLFGPSYKTGKGKLIFIYKLQVGTNQFQTRSNTAYLKEKNTNTIVIMNWSYESQDYDPGFFCISPSVSVGYRITNRLSISVDLMLMHSSGSFTYYQVAEDANTHQRQTQSFYYSNAINELNLGGSLLYLFNRKTKK